MQEKNCFKTIFFEKHWINDKMMTRAAFEIVNERGFHARPASLFVQCAEEFASTVEVKNLGSGVTADGKSLMSLLMLAAPKGTRLEITVSGPDAESALEKLGSMITEGFDED